MRQTALNLTLLQKSWKFAKTCWAKLLLKTSRTWVPLAHDVWMSMLAMYRNLMKKTLAVNTETHFFIFNNFLFWLANNSAYTIFLILARLDHSIHPNRQFTQIHLYTCSNLTIEVVRYIYNVFIKFQFQEWELKKQRNLKRYTLRYL